MRCKRTRLGFLCGGAPRVARAAVPRDLDAEIAAARELEFKAEAQRKAAREKARLRASQIDLFWGGKR